MGAGFKLYSGRGADPMDDRVFIRSKLEALMSDEDGDKAIACTIKACVIFCPADILQGVELVCVCVCACVLACVCRPGACSRVSQCATIVLAVGTGTHDA